jgi:endothelin-converting enzyme/putative endopeptidase
MPHQRRNDTSPLAPGSGLIRSSAAIRRRHGLLLAALLAVCAPFDAASAGPLLGTWGVETQHLASDVKPGDDFYRYVNEGWLKSATLPTGLPMAGSFIDLQLRTEKQITGIVADLLTHPAAPGTPRQQLADLYRSFVDMKRRDALGMSMLTDELGAILATDDRRALARRLGRIGYDGVFGTTVDLDPGHPSRYILLVTQGGLGLPDRSYYLDEGETFTRLRAAYVDYIAATLARAKVPDAGTHAAAILEFETALARVHWTPEQQRDPVKAYHVVDTAELPAYAPGFDWPGYFAELGFDRAERVQLVSDTAIQGIAATFAATPIETLRAHTAFRFLNRHAGLLSQEWSDAQFELFSHRLSGIAEQRPLEERALDHIGTYLGENLSRIYVERCFPAESKRQMEELVGFLRQALRERLEKIDWMDDGTRREALHKLETMRTKIGYPDHWRDFSSIKILPDDLVANVHAIARWHRADERARLSEPARPWEWLMHAHEINAYYSAERNEVVFPAAILQPPFFDPEADPAVNFGAIGMVIGHELCHGFDDQGSRYDATGMLRNWWDESSRKAFESRADRLVAQFNQYQPLPGIRVNGRLTLGENIGDMGGMSVAYTAYEKFLAAHGGDAPVLDGFTGKQRFFLGYAQLWRSRFADGFLRRVLLTDPHSPGEFRVNGMLCNFSPWYEAFGVGPEAALFRPAGERIVIW